MVLDGGRSGSSPRWHRPQQVDVTARIGPASWCRRTSMRRCSKPPCSATSTSPSTPPNRSAPAPALAPGGTIPRARRRLRRSWKTPLQTWRISCQAAPSSASQNTIIGLNRVQPPGDDCDTQNGFPSGCRPLRSIQQHMTWPTNCSTARHGTRRGLHDRSPISSSRALVFAEWRDGLLTCAPISPTYLGCAPPLDRQHLRWRILAGAASDSLGNRYGNGDSGLQMGVRKEGRPGNDYSPTPFFRKIEIRRSTSPQ